MKLATPAGAVKLTRSIVVALFVLATAVTSFQGSAAAAELDEPDTVRPDIIIVMVDDFGYIADERVLERLPTIRDVWLEHGLRFRRIYTQTPLCCPARATLLSGQTTLHHGVITNDGDALDPSVTIATALDDAGYHTFLMGKYLNRYDGTRTPPGWDRVMMRERNVGATFSVDGEIAKYPGLHFDDALRIQAVEWVRGAPIDEPLFAQISPRAPHRHPQNCEKGERGCQYLPLVMKDDRDAEACRDVPDFKPPNYAVVPNGRSVPWVMPRWPDGWPLGEICESMLVVDRMVAELVEAQAARGRPGYLVFMSDNGMAWGQKSFPQKHVPPATRLPLYVAGSGVPAGTSDALVSNIDIAPTLADLAGASFEAADGTSFAAVLRGAEFEDRAELLEIMPADPAGIYAGWAAIRTPAWRFIRWDSGARELYDLAADPWELENLVKDQSQRAKGLETRLDALIDESAD